MISLVAGTCLVTLSARRWVVDKCGIMYFNYVCRKAVRSMK